MSEKSARDLLNEFKPNNRPPRPLNTARIIARIRQHAREILTNGTRTDHELLELAWHEIAQEIAAAKAAAVPIN